MRRRSRFLWVSVSFVAIAAMSSCRPASDSDDPAGAQDTTTRDEWKSAVEAYVANLQSRSNLRPSDIYPQVPDRLNALFGHEGAVKVESSIQTAGEEHAKRGPTVYIEGPRIEIVDQAFGGLNLATDSNYVYLWRTGDKTCERMKRDDRDLVGFVTYYLDPGWLVAGMYSAYLERQTRDVNVVVTPSPTEGWIEIAFKNRPDAYDAIFVSENPVWFHGWRAKNDDGIQEETFVSKPTMIMEIPKEIRERRDGIRFEDSEKALNDLIVVP